MPELNEVLDPIPTSELERRWAAVRAAMEEQGIDALLAQGNNSSYGGYFKWFTDIATLAGMYASVLFPRDGSMTVFRHGPHRDQTFATPNALYPGVGRFITRPTFASAFYTQDYHADATIDELRKLGAKTIGLVNPQIFSYTYLDRIKNGGLADVRFIDATDLVDQIKAIKSDEEIALLRRCAAMQDAAMAAVIDNVRPGQRVLDIVAVAQDVGVRLGSFDGLFLAAGGPLGKPAPKAPRPYWDRVLKEGDQLTILIENNGPNGFYCEIGRTCVIGKAPQYMRDEFEFVLAAQDYTLNLIRPGAEPAAILATYNDFMRRNGRPEEDRLFAHGQGYDLVERPLFLAEETMKLAAGMNLAVHPTYLTDKEYAWVCDNYLVTETGVSDCLHKTPKQIFEV